MSISSFIKAIAVASIGLALLLTPSAPLAAATTPSSTGPCTAGWQELTVPDGSFRAVPFEAVVHNGSLAWILGSTDEGVLSLRWTGDRLTRNPAGPGGRRGFVGGIAEGYKRVLGVGFRRPRPRHLDELIGRVVGRKWIKQKVPVEKSAEAALTDAVKLPSGKVWAVGSSLKNGGSRAIALRRSGGVWQHRDPVGSGRDSGLLGVARSPGGVVWAVGWRDSSTGLPRPLIARRTGAGWKISNGASLPRGAAVLTDVAFHKRADGWAVGYLVRNGSSAYRPILMHWNGRSWQRAKLPWTEGVSSIPRSISVDKHGKLWIAGTQLATNSREARGFVAHGSGDGWKVRVLETPNDVRSDIKSVAATDAGAVAAGTVASTAIVLQTCEVTGPAARGRKIEVSKIKKRRAAKDPHVPAPALSGMDVTSPGPSVNLASPIRPSGFRIRDMAWSAGLAGSTQTYGALAGDFDGNGWKDVLISRHWVARPLLALGGPDGFEAAPAGAFSATDRHGCDAADVDKDGRKDILCVVGRQRGTAIHRHELAMAPAYDDHVFARAARGISDPLGRGRAVAFIRLDADAYPEVFITNQPEREDSMPAPNRFFRNVGGRFVPAPEVGLDNASGGYCADGIDVDGDGDQDLLHCQTFPTDGRPAGLRIYRNRGGTLVERSKAMGVKPIGDIDVAMADVTGDGKRDLIQLSDDSLRVSRRTATGFTKIYQVDISWAKAVAAGDVNGDGRADIYVVRSGSTTNKPDRLLISKRNGKAFTSVTIPLATRGSGDDAVALDYDKNGLTDFLVLNGRGRNSGPIQLLAAFPTVAP